MLLLVLVSCLVFAVPKAECGHPLLKDGDAVTTPGGNHCMYADGRFLDIGTVMEIEGRRLEEGDIITRLFEDEEGGYKHYKHTKGKLVELSIEELQELEDSAPTVSYDNSKYCCLKRCLWLTLVCLGGYSK